jgi:ParB family transcriptional regulator, chromosome partitioning protein
MTTSNAAVDKSSEKSLAGKVSEKMAEKRRALGRGLESLLPGPRPVTPPPVAAASTLPSPALPQSTRKDGAADGDSSQFSVLSSQQTGAAISSVAPPEAGTLDSVHAAAELVTDGDRAIELELDQIEQNPYQTRTEFEPRALNDLAASIQVQGVLQPIVVRPATLPTGQFGYTDASQTVRAETAGTVVQPLRPMVPGGKPRYTLILGERRYRASKLAGKTTIPAIVKRVSERQAAEMTVVENLQREDLHCLDQAVAFSKLSKEFDMTQEEIGQRVGVSREQVSNYLRLLKLPAEVMNALRTNELTYTHARLLLTLRDDNEITKLARVVIEKKMSVALLEEMVIDSHVPKSGAEKPGGGARWVDPNVRAAQRSLEAALGVRVKIRDKKGRGKITIEYETLEDFDRVVGMLKGGVKP